ncbi:hypothetical protein ACT4UL_19725, partial [Bacillus sp. HC-TM]
EIMSTGVAGGVFITLFIIVELKVKQPMLDLRLLKEPVFRKMSLISLFSSAGLLASEWANNNVNLEIINESTIKISSNASQIGQISETQQIDAIQGEKQLNISFDGRFMVDALRAIKEETITLSFGGSMRPILIEAGEQSAAVHLISPVRAY